MGNKIQRGHLPLLLLSSLLLTFLTGSLPIARAANLNLLYISPSQQGPFLQGSTVTYQAKVAQMDPFNAWDIMVETNPSVLNPVSLTVTPNVLTANFSITTVEFSNCVNGSGTSCNPSNGDGPGVVHSAVQGYGESPPVSNLNGVLFTITYAVVNGSGLSSVSIFNDVIVSSVDGSSSLVSHGTTNAIYGNAELPVVDFFWSPMQPALGQIVTFSSNSSDPNPGASIVSYIWNFGDGTGPHFYGANAAVIYTRYSGGVPVNSSITPSGITTLLRFMVTLTIVDSLGLTNSVTLQVLVVHFVPKPLPDFFLGLSLPVPKSFSAGSTTTVDLVLASLNNFTGTVSLSSSVSPALPNAPTLSFNPASVTLIPNANESSSVTVLVSSLTVTVPGNYNFTVFGTFASKVHSVSFSIAVVPFSIEAKPSDLVLQDGQSGTFVLTLSSINGFSGTLQLGTNTSCLSGCTTSLTRDIVTLFPDKTATVVVTVSVATYTEASPFTYLLNIFAQTTTSPFFTIVNEIPFEVPLLEPVFVRQGLSWTHRLSLSNTLSSQTWTAQISNPNGGDALEINIHIVGRNSQGSLRFTADSGPLRLQPGETKVNVTITHVFSASDIGQTFNFEATIQWGFNFLSLNQVSSSTETGSFTIVG